MPNINDYGLPFTSQDGDRKYSALEWREYFSRLIHNGLIQNAANECQVKPQAAPNKTVYVDTGVVFINGAMRVLDAPAALAVAENTSGNSRIDRVVARLNEASRTIEFDVLEGTPAGSPVAPALTRTAGVYELGLADITLANGYSTITTTEIADQRWDISLCGASSMTIGVIPPSGLEAETVTLSPETAGLYGEGNVDAALKIARGDTASYQAFCANVSTTAIETALGKNNEDEVLGIGRQLSMYSWYKGADKVTNPFSNLKICQKLIDILSNPGAKTEVIGDTNISTLLQLSSFAMSKIGSIFPKISIFNNGNLNNPLTGNVVEGYKIAGATIVIDDKIRLTGHPTNGASTSAETNLKFWPKGAKFIEVTVDSVGAASANNLIFLSEIQKTYHYTGDIRGINLGAITTPGLYKIDLDSKGIDRTKSYVFGINAGQASSLIISKVELTYS